VNTANWGAITGTAQSQVAHTANMTLGGIVFSAGYAIHDCQCIAGNDIRQYRNSEFHHSSRASDWIHSRRCFIGFTPSFGTISGVMDTAVIVWEQWT